MNEWSPTKSLREGEGREGWSLEVTDIKQYAYCPRVVYYRYCLPTLRRVTHKMHAGKAAHQVDQRRERRRSLAAYGLESGERYYDVHLYSPRMGLSGIVDMVIVHENEKGREAIPVDYKFARKARRSWKQQLAAYGMLLEEAWGLPVRHGYIYLLMLRKAEKVRISAREKGAARAILGRIREMIDSEQTPEPSGARGRCVDCEFRRFCNDVF